MKTLSERMNMKFGVVADAYVMTNVHKGFAAYEALCLVCHEFGVNLSDVSHSDFKSSKFILTDFVNSANDDTGYTVSVWFD